MTTQNPTPGGAESNRATRSGAAGYRADTDDWLRELEHDEQRIDPNKEHASRQNGRAGGAPMMPPMMGGMGGAGTGAAAGGTAAASSAGLAGAGAAGRGAGLGAMGGGGSMAASGDGPLGIDTDGDGIADTFAGGGIDTDGDGIPDLFPGDPGYPGGSGYGGGSGVGAGAGLEGSGSGYEAYVPKTYSYTPGGPYVAPDGGSGLGEGDLELVPSEISSAASQWSQVSSEMTQLQYLAQQVEPNRTNFGFITPPTAQYANMHGNITKWSEAAHREFGVMSNKLVKGASSYRELEDDQIKQSGTINEEDPA